MATALAPAQGPVSSAEQLVRSEAPSSEIERERDVREPWLGVSIHKPTDALYERLTSVPRSVGFVVHRVTEGGPAGEAGLRQADFLWKLEDQFLVNEAQLVVLLQQRKVGDTVSLTYQRDGENHEAKVVLRERPTEEMGRKEADIAMMNEPPVPGLPNQVVDILRQVAEIKGVGGSTVRLERQGEVFHWQQLDSIGAVIQEGDVKGVEDIRFPPGTNEDLAKKLRAMIRAFEDSERRAKSGVRSPRVRRVPTED
jgi:hypothetical protein